MDGKDRKFFLFIEIYLQKMRTFAVHTSNDNNDKSYHMR